MLAGLVQNSVYVNPFYGENLLSIPVEIFNVSWVYQTSFALPSAAQGDVITLQLRGINYMANITLNGHAVGEYVGTFRYFDIDISSFVAFGVEDTNELSIEIHRPQDRSLPPNNNDTDLAISFVDWSPSPPDR